MKMTLTLLAAIQFLNQAPSLPNVADRTTGERGDDIAWRQTVSFQPGCTLGTRPFSDIQGAWTSLPNVSLYRPIDLISD